MNAILLGSNSDLGRDLAKRLIADGYQVWGWSRGQSMRLIPPWNLILCAIGQVAPVGPWHAQDAQVWDSAIESNLLTPLRLVRELWDRRQPDATVCFLAGSNPQRVMPNYTAYATGKMGLLKAIEHIDTETPDAKFFALATGYVPTKIHKATLEAGVHNDVIARGTQKNTMDRIYGCLQWCIAQPKEVVGGRNICASDRWDMGTYLHDLLRDFPDVYKLRRYGDDK